MVDVINYYFLRNYEIISMNLFFRVFYELNDEGLY